jgi:hypothetical protein
MFETRWSAVIPALLTLGSILLLPGTGRAHCDGMDGPVVMAAQKALASGDLDLVLVWVQARDEAEIQQAFERALAVRGLGDDARELADRYFFETLVRIHRAGEGAPYTGLKPEGSDFGAAIPLADRAVVTGEIEPLADLITHRIHRGLLERHAGVMKARSYESSDVEAGREFVRAYVDFVHYAEATHHAAITPAGEHAAEQTHGGHAVDEPGTAAPSDHPRRR